MYRFARTSPQDPRAVGLTGALGLQLSDNSVLGKSTLFDNPPQLIDPSLRGGNALFPNLRVGNFGREALAEDLTPYRVAKMFRPDVINMNASNPRLAKAANDIQFQKAGQSPGQAKALGELIRQDPALGNSFNVGYGSTLNREQGLAQKQGRVYEFDPTDEMWKSGFKRKNPDIVAMDDLQDALRTLPSGSQLTTYDGRPLDPSFTKAYYNLDATQDINDPQLFYNLKGKSDVDYGRIAQALDSIPLDKTKKADYSLAKRWERVQNYSPYPPSGATYVLNADKPYQSVDEIMAEVNQVEPWRTPRVADSRIARSQGSGNSDLNIIPKDFTRKEYLEATGDSDNLPPVAFNSPITVSKQFGEWSGDYVDRNGYPLSASDFARATNDPSTVIEDRTFLLSSPDVQLPIRASASILPQNYYGAKRNIPTGIEGVIRGFNIKKNPYPSVDLPVGYYGIERDIPTSLSAIEEGLTGRKGSVVGYANTRKAQRPTTRLEREEIGADYFNPYRDYIPQGRTEIGDMYVQNFSDAGAEKLGATLGEDYYRMPRQDYSVGYLDDRPVKFRKDNGQPIYQRNFYSPEAILPASLVTRVQPYSGNAGISPNNFRIAGSTSELGGYNEFNEVMDKGVKVSRRLDRLYGLSDLAAETPMVGDIPARTADLIKMNRYDNGIRIAQPMGNIFEYIQPDVLDEIVDAERIVESMGGTYRRLSGKNDQGSFEQERMAYEGRPSALTQYNVDDVLEPSFGSDYSGRANTGRIRVPSGIDYDAGIPIPTSRTRLASSAIDPIQLQDDFVEPFNQAQYTRDLIDRGGILIDAQLGVPILKAPTTAYNPATQREAIVNVGGAEVNTPKNITYLQPVRPSRVANGVANWQAPESLAVGRVGKQTPIIGIPELPTDTGMTVERRASSPMASIQRELMSDNSVALSPWFKAPLPSRDWTTTTQGQILYPNAGIGSINTGLKPKPTIGELFGFTAITPEGLAKYRDMG